MSLGAAASACHAGEPFLGERLTVFQAYALARCILFINRFVWAAEAVSDGIGMDDDNYTAG